MRQTTEKNALRLVKTPQSHAVLQTFVWWWVQTCPPPPHTNTQMSVNVRNFGRSYLSSLKTFHFQIWQVHYF